MDLIKKIIPAQIKDYIKEKAGVPNMFKSLQNLKRLGFEPKFIVDAGAYNGDWAEKTSKLFTKSNILMIEALQHKVEKLQNLKRSNDKIDFEIAVLSACDGQEIEFTEIESASSVLEEVATVHHRTSRISTSLNSILLRRLIDKVDFIKLDVQGYELEVLKGFDKYLPETDLILTEVSFLDIHKQVPLIKDVIDFMAKYGFVVYDVCSVSMRRPLDKAPWQTDLMFVKENSQFRQDKRYQ